MSTLELNGKDFATQTSSAEPVIASTVTGAPALAVTNVTGVLPAGVTGGAGLSGSTSLGTVTAGTLNSTVTFPAGHVLQMKATTIGDPAINGGYTDGDSGDFQGVSQSDLTLNRTANTHVIYTLLGGGAYKSVSGSSLYLLGRRTTTTSYTGSEVDLGNSTYGHCRVYGGTDLLLPMSVMAHDSANINGDYTYRFFFRFTSADQDFSADGRGDINVTIIEFKPS